MKGLHWCKVSVGLRVYAIWNPLELAFKVGGRLTPMSDPSGRDVKQVIAES